MDEPSPEVRLLLVEDEEDTRATLKWRLQTRQFNVIEAVDGVEAFEKAKTERPEIILLDIMMPGRDGFQVYQDLKQEPATREIPVIFLTALSSSGPLSKQGLQLLATTKHEMELTGHFDVLGKPFELDELLRRISVLLRERPQASREEDQAI
jgi:DNA-binding response OmpR family regulator